MSPPKSTTRLICPLTAPTPEAMRRQMISAARQGADAVECRLDWLARPPGERELRLLLSGAPLPVIATNRPLREGGRFAGDESRRLEVLREAARFAPAYVDVELGTPRQQWPQAPVILSHHDLSGPPADLEAIAAELDRSDAAVAKVAFAARTCEDAFRALDVLRTSGKPAMALAMGEAGLASRVLAGKLGAFGTFAALERGAESAPGQPTLAELRTLYRWDRLRAETRVFGVIGCPVGHSMSPAIHNAAFDAAGIDGVYLPLRVEPGAGPFARFMDALRARPWLDWVGLSVTIPHKENALAYVGAARCDALAARIGAVNTVTLHAGGTGDLRGDNTDYAAAMDALCAAMGIARGDLAGRAVAVIGAGGAARAVVAALAYYGARVTVYNRTVERGTRLAAEFGARAAPLPAAASADAEVLINCTPIGMHPRVDASPLDRLPGAVKVVFDTIYNPVETQLLRRAAAAGRATVTGLEMFVNQAAAQFETWTGTTAPRDVMRAVVKAKLGAGSSG